MNSSSPCWQNEVFCNFPSTSPLCRADLNGDQPMTARDIATQVYILAKDQHGCRLLQRMLEDRDKLTFEVIFTEVWRSLLSWCRKEKKKTNVQIISKTFFQLKLEVSTICICSTPRCFLGAVSSCNSCQSALKKRRKNVAKQSSKMYNAKLRRPPSCMGSRPSTNTTDNHATLSQGFHCLITPLCR